MEGDRPTKLRRTETGGVGYPVASEAEEKGEGGDTSPQPQVLSLEDATRHVDVPATEWVLVSPSETEQCAEDEEEDVLATLGEEREEAGETREAREADMGDGDGGGGEEGREEEEESVVALRPLRGGINITAWLRGLRAAGTTPRQILLWVGMHLPDEVEDLDNDLLWKVCEEVFMELRERSCPRKKLPHVNTIDQVCTLLEKSKNIVVLTGAGVSVSCGIPDFRSDDGFYNMMDKYDIPEPQAMFDIHFFRIDPTPFFKFAHEIFPGNFRPSPSHYFIKMLESKNKLLRNYSQNIDTLEKVAGIERVLECHGSFATASCLNCKRKVPGEAIKGSICDQAVPRCAFCDEENSVMKPDIVFFGEPLPDIFGKSLEQDVKTIDLLIVMGSSLKVRPVASVIAYIPPDVPQILINREVVGFPNCFDVELLGDCDGIVDELCQRLGWELPSEIRAHVHEENPFKPSPPACDVDELGPEGSVRDGEVLEEEVEDVFPIFAPPNRYIFPGAELPSMIRSPYSTTEDDDDDDDESDTRSEIDVGSCEEEGGGGQGQGQGQAEGGDDKEGNNGNNGNNNNNNNNNDDDDSDNSNVNDDTTTNIINAADKKSDDGDEEAHREDATV